MKNILAALTLFCLVFYAPPVSAMPATQANVQVDGLPICGLGSFNAPLDIGASVWLNSSGISYLAWSNVAGAVAVDSGGYLGTSGSEFNSTHLFSYNGESPPSVAVYFCRAAETPTPDPATTPSCEGGERLFYTTQFGGFNEYIIPITEGMYKLVFDLQSSGGGNFAVSNAAGATQNGLWWPLGGAHPVGEVVLLPNHTHIDVNAANATIFGFVDACPLPATPTNTAAATNTTAPTNTSAPTNTPTNTRTSTPTATLTPTLTPTATETPIATPALPPCPVMDSINIPVAPDYTTVPLATGSQFAVAGASVWFNVNDQPREIRQGSYVWDLPSGSFNAYSLTVAATVWLCVRDFVTPTVTVTGLPTPGATSPSIGGTPACFPMPTATAFIAYAMPDLSLVLPTMRPLGSPTVTGTITATAALSSTEIAAFFATIEAGVSTPAAAMGTVTASYSWQAGASLSATTVSQAAPALAWMSIFNPSAPAWQLEGGPLWALAPLILPVLPILVVLFVVLFARLVLFVVDLVLKAIDLVIKLIELIPGE